MVAALDGLPPEAGLGDVVGDLPAGPALAAVLATVDLDSVGDADLVEAVEAAVRVQSWAQATATRAAAALARRDSMNPSWSPRAGGAPSVACVAGDELAMRLGWSRRAATRLVRHGLAFEAALFPTGDALAAGRIDPCKAALIVERLVDEPGQVALAVQDVVLDRADRRTPAQLATDLARALIAVDPTEAARRHQRARAGRRVDRPKVLPDGMAGMWAVLPAATAVRMHGALDSAARTARAAGDPRTLDQLRADGLADLVLHTACARSGSGAAPAPAVATPTGPAAGAGAAYGTAAAYGTGAAGAAGAVGGAGSAGAAGAAYGAGAAAGAAVDAALAASAGPGYHDDARRADAPVVVDGERTRGCRRQADRAQVRVTVALSTLMGVDDLPAELAGYGPVDATTARALAAGGVWRRLVTDPLSGTLLDVGRTRYRPPAALAEHVQTRDGTCARPGCPTPASACDLDHTVEFHGRPDAPDAPLGTTAHDNLSPLCRRDHRLKTDGGFVLRQREPGVLEWTTPTGHRYLVVPGREGHHEHLGTGRPPRRPGGDADQSGTARGPGAGRDDAPPWSGPAPGSEPDDAHPPF